MGLLDRLASTRAFLRIAPRFAPQLDRLAFRLSGGRFMVSDGRVPALVLHAVGAKSGQPRDTPLACMPDGDAFYVVGSNYGKPAHPAWSANLLAHPDVAVTHRGTRRSVRARLLDADEKAAVWPRLTAVWPNYDRYVELSGRDLRVFRLEPRSE
jgi:deazaflavin-dependent oxidoreductase (nitroreductase family)